MNRVRVQWWLGRRLLRAPSQRIGLLTVFLVSVLAGLLLVSLCAVPGTLAAARHAEADRTVVNTGSPTGVAASTAIWDWRDEQSVTTVRVGFQGASEAPRVRLPGVPYLPQNGTVWLSPQLMTDIRTDPDLERAFAGRVAGLISEDALTSSQERLAYVGVPVDRLTASGVPLTSAFGAQEPETRGTPLTTSALVLLTVLLFLGVPISALFVGTYGALMATRSRQIALLRSLGLTPARAQVTASADGVLVGLVGATLSWVCFEVLTSVLTSLPFTPAQWTAGRPSITPLGAVLSLMTPLLAAGWAARRSVSSPTSRRSNVRVQTRLKADHLWVAVLAASVVAVLASSLLRVDQSPWATAIVVSALTLLVVSAPKAVMALQRQMGRRLLRRGNNGSALIVGARLARTVPNGARTMAMLLPALLLALAVAPLLSQMAPRDSLTAETNQRLGRVVALVSPVPDPSAREHIRALPGVLAVSAPSEGPNPRYRFDCQAFKTLLAQRPCDQPLDASQMNGDLSAGWPYLGSWTFTTDPTTRPATDPDQEVPAIVLMRNTDTYWQAVAAIQGLDPLLSVSGNIGGLIGGPDQQYRLLQRWLEVGVALMLITGGGLLVLGVTTDVSESMRLRRGLSALGATPRTLSRHVGGEVLARSLVVLGLAVTSGLAVVVASHGWSNTDTVALPWAAAALATLATSLMASTGAAALLAARPQIAEHSAADAYR